MVFFSEKKWPRLMLIAYLAAAVMGTFTFAVIEPFLTGDFEAHEPISEGSFMPIDYVVDCLVGGGAVIDKARGHSFSPLRNGVLRISTALGIQNAGIAVSHRSLKTIEKTNPFDIKNTILLKLRI